jgi:hypothetical protein
VQALALRAQTGEQTPPGNRTASLGISSAVPATTGLPCQEPK